MKKMFFLFFVFSFLMKKMLSGTSSQEIQVKAPAAEFWDIYGTPKVTVLLLKKHAFQTFELLAGDGGVGSVVKVTIAPDPSLPGVTYQIEKYTVIDKEKRVRVTEVFGGEILALGGFTRLRVRTHVLEKDENSCIVKISVEYEVPKEAADKLAFVLKANPFAGVINVVADALNKGKEKV